jgi:signal transduction histidine kinase
MAGMQDPAELADKALRLALELTGATVAFIGLVDDAGNRQEVYSRAAGVEPSMTGDQIDALFAAARRPSNRTRRAPLVPDHGLNDYVGTPLKAGGKVIGMMGVAGGSVYTVVQRRAFAILANQVAAAIEMSRMHQRRQELVEALVNMRAELDRSEQQQVLTEARAQAAIRIEKAHGLALDALAAVSNHARTGAAFSDFYRDLTRSVAELVGAGRVLFWQLNENRTLTAIPGGHGIDEAFFGRLYPVPAEPFGTDLASQVVYNDLVVREASSDPDGDSLPNARVLEVLGVSSAISVPWRAGDQRLGLVAAYDSVQPEGFSMEDAWVLQMAGLAAGLVWQLKLAESDLTSTIYRLQRVDEARQLLLRNMTTAVDEARRGFANELHDDALQKLTGAELHLQRSDQLAPPVVAARELLDQAEQALRKVLFDVRPPALEVPGGFEQTIRDRVTITRNITGIEADLDFDIPDDQPIEIKSIIFRQVSEALANIEKHAAATHVQVSLREDDGGIRGAVVDDGRGFVVTDREHLPGHLGLLALQERALLAGGWCQVTSDPGAGTRVEFWVPLPD